MNKVKELINEFFEAWEMLPQNDKFIYGILLLLMALAPSVLIAHMISSDFWIFLIVFPIWSIMLLFILKATGG